MTLILACPGEHRGRAAPAGLPIAHMVYRLGTARIYRTEPPVFRGGLMAVDCSGAFEGSASVFASDVVRECRQRSFSGVFFDRETPPGRRLAEACSAAAHMARAAGLEVYVSPALAGDAGGGSVLISTAVSRGTLEGRLAAALSRYGGRPALDAERLRADYPLPAPEGSGRRLSAEELETLRRRYAPKTFFSAELCTNYFSYRSGGQPRIVLFDDGASLRRKLERGRQAGFRTAFLFFPEVEDLLPELTR